ncbi:MAG: hypothetical protein HQK76_12775 [Desulfobacterales bacterium]|nr:hypothetical protein [Desulfobacterales bacterium]
MPFDFIDKIIQYSYTDRIYNDNTDEDNIDRFIPCIRLDILNMSKSNKSIIITTNDNFPYKLECISRQFGTSKADITYEDCITIENLEPNILITIKYVLKTKKEDDYIMISEVPNKPFNIESIESKVMILESYPQISIFIEFIMSFVAVVLAITKTKRAASYLIGDLVG